VPADVSRQTYPFSLPNLPYAYDALEPHVDTRTMQLHHREHHSAYVKKLNEALAKDPELHSLTLEQLLLGVDKLPEALRAAVKNNAGGHFNHDFFWNGMTPGAQKAPTGALASAIDSQFGSFAEFRKQFSDAAAKHFASGWVTLAFDHAARKLEIRDLKDHEVLKFGEKTGLIILDVWEHAYYLKHQNRRPEFIEAFWNVVNWQRAADALSKAQNAR
jgi:Fe-Mn family superoxide dismutase